MADKDIKDLEVEASENVDNTVEEEVNDTVDTASDDAKKNEKSDKKSKEEKKPGFFKRFGSLLKRFWKTMKSELKKVTWFTRKQTYNSTLLVLLIMAAAAIVIGLLDLGFSHGLEALANLF